MSTTKRPSRGARAFTLIELLVVIVIIALLAAIALPAFSRIIGSNEETLAESTLALAVRQGRDAAVRAPVGSDAGVVFFYDPASKTTSAVPVVKVGEIDDTRGGPNGPAVRREVFVPTLGVEPVQLPRYWHVRGFSAPGTIVETSDWYEWPTLDAYAQTLGVARYEEDAPNWVFPETGFFLDDDDEASGASQSTLEEQGPNRQSFMLRFQGGTGVFMGADPREVLVVSPTRGKEWRPQNVVDRWKRADLADDLGRWVQRILVDRTLTAAQRRELLGARSSDVVTVRSVAQLALYQESDLAADLNLDLDRVTGTVYRDVDSQAAYGPALVNGAEPRSVNRWILGDTNNSGVVEDADGGDEPRAKIFVIDRYRGETIPVEVQP